MLNLLAYKGEAQLRASQLGRAERDLETGEFSQSSVRPENDPRPGIKDLGTKGLFNAKLFT